MKTSAFIAFLLVFSLLHPHTIAAQPTTEPSVCEYTGKWENPETFQRPSITKDKIRRCLQAKIMIANHHIAFEDYRDAWQELAKETGDYAIPLLLRGGVLHANTPYDNANTPRYEVDTGGIRLGEFRDPMVKDASKLTEEERKIFGIEKQDSPIILIRSRIEWESVYVDSAVSVVVERESMHPNGNTPLIIFRKIATFRGSTFSKEADLKRSAFMEEVDFSGSNFNGTTDFMESIFIGDTDFYWSAFRKVASFGNSTFSGNTDFRESIFSDDADFTGTTFIEDTDFGESIFRKVTSFSRSTFSKLAFFGRSTFSGNTDFTESIFSGNTDLNGADFSKEADFGRSTFSGNTDFSWSTFSKEADFREVQFWGNADFRYMIVAEQLIFDNNTYHKRLDLRGMSAKTFQWDSTDSPSNVQGVVDMREAYIGSAIVKEVRFQDLVDFSRMTFGQYKIIEENNNVKVEKYPYPQLLFENNTLENEADFLHVKFNAPTVFINNRFRRTLDFTGATFEAQNSQVQNSHLCLSFNRINRLVFEPEHLGNPPGISPYQQFMSLFTNPLHTSRVRRVDAPECMLSAQTASNPENATQDEEPLDDIYRTLGKSFREANDRAGINEAWYLQTLAERDNGSVGGQLGRIFLDIPSRYSVDVWRSVWISVFIMIVFYPFYALEFWRIDRANQRNLKVPRLTIQTTAYTTRPRTFRFRIFESFFAKNNSSARRIIPLWDGAMLSIRSFLKLGLGTTYPKSRVLRILTGLEWVLGVFMLVHFILAVKNNLPFILPFLGAVN